MTRQEFENLTGFKPTQNYFDYVIHPEYMKSEDDKRTWCKKWIKERGFQNAYDTMVARAVVAEQDVEHTQNMNNSLVEENARLRATCKDMEDDNILLRKKVKGYESTMYALIHILQKDGDPELRKLILSRISFKNYITYKLENNLNLFEVDKQEILNNLK